MPKTEDLVKSYKIIYWICLEKFQLTPIERYAVQYTEQMMEPVNEEELKIAEVCMNFHAKLVKIYKFYNVKMEN